jgi:acyl-CoA synthetase (NDP forming)
LTDRIALRRNLRRLLSPRNIAFVGGQTNIPAIEMLQSTGFDGPIWPVHPSRTTLTGLPVFRSVADLPAPPDATFLNVPGSAIEGLIGELRAAGAGGAVCFAAGYAELGDDGRAAQAALARAAGPLAVIGPNSTGFLNYFDRTALWPVHDHSPRHMDRGVAILSASGGVLFNYSINQRSLYPAVMIGIGNQAVVGVADYIDVLADDPRVTAIGLFLEDIGDPVAFSHAAARAFARDLPIVAMKTGRSAKGAEVAQTHSGAMVAPDDLIDALFDRCGVIRVRSLPQFDETLKMLTIPRQPTGRRLALLTNSGGEKALAADAAEGTLITFPAPSPAATESLRAQIPDFAAVSNPFDYNAHFAGKDIFSMENEAALENCFRTMIADGYDVAVILNGYRSRPDGTVDARENVLTPTREAFVKACKAVGISGVVASVMPEHMPFVQREYLIEHGIAPLMGLDEAMVAVDGAMRRAEQRAMLQAGEFGLPPVRENPRPGRLVDEASGKAALAALGLALPDARVARDTNAAVAAAEAIGFPVVVKVLEPVIAHKAKAGGVALNLTSTAAVTAAMAAMQSRLADDGHILRQVLVEKMVTDARHELIIGVTATPGFGQVMVLGRGGVDAELNGFADKILLPVSDSALASFIDRARVTATLSSSVRGGVLAAARVVADFAARNRDRLVAIDINPLIVGPDDRVTAVDVLIETAD